MAQTRSFAAFYPPRGDDTEFSPVRNSTVVGDGSEKQGLGSAMKNLVVEPMVTKKNENETSVPSTMRHSCGSNASGTATERTKCFQHKRTSLTLIESHLSENIRPIAAKHQSSGRRLLKKRRILSAEVQYGSPKHRSKTANVEFVECFDRGTQQQDEGAFKPTSRANNLVVVSNTQSNVQQVEHIPAASEEIAPGVSGGDGEINTAVGLGAGKVKEKTMKRELMKQERSRRKRIKEKQRRSDVNKGFDDLTALLKLIDPVAAVGKDKNQERGTGSGKIPDSPPSRVVLMSRTVNILQSLYDENIKLTQTVHMLRQAQETQFGCCESKILNATGTQQTKVSHVLQQGRSDEAALLLPLLAPYGTPNQQTRSSFLPMSVAQNSMLPSVHNFGMCHNSQNAWVQFATQQQQLPLGYAIFPTP